MTLRIAILGVGWAGERHVRAIRELRAEGVRDDVAVACLVDNDAAFLHQKSEELGVPKTYVDIRPALADPEVDAVSICLPHALHCPVAIEAAQAKKHVLVEKPMALTVDEATQMIVAAEAHGVKLYVAENVAYAVSAKMLREIVQTGRYIGNLTFASLTRGFRAQQYGYPGRRAWLSTPDLGGTGTWMLHGIHSMAELRFILGEVATVYMGEHKAQSFERRDLEGTMSGLLTLTNGVHVAVNQTAETHLVHDLRGYTLYGDAGVVRSGRDGITVFSKTLNPDETPVFFPYSQEPISPYAQEIAAFVDYVLDGTVGPTTAHSERRSLAIVQAGYESARTGLPVHLAERFRKI
jgi:predicted dehydrogenase